MATEKQLAANRANAQKSTGPVTPEGKAASSRNSFKSGIYAKALIIPGEDPAELEALRDEFHRLYLAEAVDECALVDTLIANEWTLRRLRKCSTQMWEIAFILVGKRENLPQDSVLGGAFSYDQQAFLNIQRLIDSAERNFHRALLDLQRLRKSRQLAQPADPLPAVPQPVDLQPVDPEPTTPELAPFLQTPASQGPATLLPAPQAGNPDLSV